ncbi:DUF2510 domain-containing protein [Nocardioides antri]|uniref:DUF2510 domain-containing protein n=1 Tax=Nocardioides antri TaxID=2607659 RepID=A0A5B1M8K9_9ACTN|nr:DUF2510 domain-containing protein [Nocardioides antri]KAA1428237.1 DUF2510 domain-containing protein [Nocardioides antri]
MTQAGWYPDPAGQPQTFRYWDGSSWSQETTSNPYAPPPAAAGGPPPPPPPPAAPPSQQPQTVFSGGPTPPSPYGQLPPQPQAFGAGYPPSPAGSSRGSALTILLVVAAVLALVGLSVGGFFGYRAFTDDDDSDADASEQPSATDSATTEPTEPTGSTDPTDTTGTSPTESASTGVETTEQQCAGGRPQPSNEPPAGAQRVTGGGLSIPIPDGYTADISYAEQFTFADDFTPLQKVIEQTDQSGWVSIYGVGGLSKGNGFTDPEQAAEVVMSCMAQSTDLYAFFTGREDLSSGEITIDGNEAYQITAELRVDNPDLTVEGDVAQVIVVDMGDAETFGLYITVVPIGDQALIDQQEAAVGQIRAD